MTLHNFIEMGGYAVYVWSAYGITLAVFALNAVLCFIEKQKVRKQVKYFANI